jgi:hypothetical protein
MPTIPHRFLHTPEGGLFHKPSVSVLNPCSCSGSCDLPGYALAVAAGLGEMLLLEEGSTMLLAIVCWALQVPRLSSVLANVVGDHEHRNTYSPVILPKAHVCVFVCVCVCLCVCLSVCVFV